MLIGTNVVYKLQRFYCLQTRLQLVKRQGYKSVYKMSLRYYLLQKTVTKNTRTTVIKFMSVRKA